MVDPPIVDSSTESVYVFVGDGCDATPGNSYVNRFDAGTSISASYGAELCRFRKREHEHYCHRSSHGLVRQHVLFGRGEYREPLCLCKRSSVPDSHVHPQRNRHRDCPHIQHDGQHVRSASTCSPVTEFYNGTQDWLFMSVVANGNKAGCTGACLYNFNVQGAGTTGNPTDSADGDWWNQRDLRLTTVSAEPANRRFTTPRFPIRHARGTEQREMARAGARSRRRSLRRRQGEAEIEKAARRLPFPNPFLRR